MLILFSSKAAFMRLFLVCTGEKMFDTKRKEITESYIQTSSVYMALPKSKTTLNFRYCWHGSQVYFVLRDIKTVLGHPKHGTKAMREFEKAMGRNCIVSAPISCYSHGTVYYNIIPIEFAECLVLRRYVPLPYILEWQHAILDGSFRQNMIEQLPFPEIIANIKAAPLATEYIPEKRIQQIEQEYSLCFFKQSNYRQEGADDNSLKA